MATKLHTSVPVGALISILVATLIGSAPVAAFLTLQERMGAGLGQ